MQYAIVDLKDGHIVELVSEGPGVNDELRSVYNNLGHHPKEAKTPRQLKKAVVEVLSEKFRQTLYPAKPEAPQKAQESGVLFNEDVIDRPTRMARRIYDVYGSKVSRKEAIDYAVSCGINRNTARTQYHYWHQQAH